jgi:hypothetical protein
MTPAIISGGPLTNRWRKWKYRMREMHKLWLKRAAQTVVKGVYAVASFFDGCSGE